MAGQWYLAIGGQQVGPMPEQDLVERLRSGSIDTSTLVFTAGMQQWTPLGSVPHLAAHVAPAAPVAPVAVAAPAAAAVAAAPAVSAASAAASSSARRAHEIDYEVHGNEMQFVEVALDPGESIVAEAGSMMYMTDGIQMETVFGDASAPSGGFMDKLVGAGKRLLTGESLFMTVFTNHGQGVHRVAFAAPYAGKILALDLATLGGELICQKDSFLCAAKGVSVGIAFQKKIGVGLFGGEGFIMQRLKGDGLCFAHAGGTIHALDLAAGQTLRVDTGCLVALQPTVNYDIQFVGKVKTALFGGEGLFFATLTGPGHVWLQSLPLSRMADRIVKAARTGGRREEGSVLDKAFGLGNVIDGD